MDKGKFETVIKILERAENMNLLTNDRFTLSIDLYYADKEFGLRFNDLLLAEDTDFSHDICGIQRNKRI